MRVTNRPIAAMTSAAYFLAACATAPSEPKDLGEMSFPDARLTTLQVTVTGEVGPVLQSGNIGQLVLTRDGSSEAIGIDFENGKLSAYELPPGSYSIAMIGPLACEELNFRTTTGTTPVALGSLTAEIIKNDNYFVALMSSTAANDAEIAGIAHGLNVAPETVDSTPINIPRSAACHQSYINPGWQPTAGEVFLLTLKGVWALTCPVIGVASGMGGMGVNVQCSGE